MRILRIQNHQERNHGLESVRSQPSLINKTLGPGSQTIYQATIEDVQSSLLVTIEDRHQAPQMHSPHVLNVHLAAHHADTR